MSQKWEGRLNWLPAFILCVLVVLVICGGCMVQLLGGLMPDYSQGERAGRLIKISKKGVIWKSWEGQLVLNDFAIGEGGSNLFEFSATDDDVGHELEKLVGQKVTVTYSQFLIAPMQQSTACTVKGAKPQGQ
jgi:hypothetical protein